MYVQYLIINFIASGVIAWILSIHWLNFLSWHSVILWLIVYDYRSHMRYLEVSIYAQRLWPVRRRFSTDHSCLCSLIPIIPWLRSGTKLLLDIVDLDHSSRQYLSFSNQTLIRFLAVFHGGFLDFSLSVGTSFSFSVYL